MKQAQDFTTRMTTASHTVNEDLGMVMEATRMLVDVLIRLLQGHVEYAWDDNCGGVCTDICSRAS